MAERELVVVSGDGIGREVIPLAVKVLRALRPDLRCVDGEAGAGHARRTKQVIDEETVQQIEQAGSALLGPELLTPSMASALSTLTQVLDLFAVLYPFHGEAQEIRLGLLMTHAAPSEGAEPARELTPVETWQATRLGNLAAQVARQGRGRVVIAHDSEEPFAHAVQGGLGAGVRSERLDAVYLLNHFASLAPELDLVVTSAATGSLLLKQAYRHIHPQTATGRLFIGASVAVATPAHGPLTEQAEWGFANPVGAIRAALALLRHHWGDEANAERLESALTRTLARRRTPDLGGIHTMYEVTRALLQEVRREW